MVGADRKQLHVVPAADLTHPLTELGCELKKGLAKRVDSRLLDVINGAVGDDVSDLPVVVPVDENGNLPLTHPSLDRVGFFRPAGNPKPEDVHGCRRLLDGDAAPLPDHRITPIGPDRKQGVDLAIALWAMKADACDTALSDHQVGNLRLHQQVEVRRLPPFLREELEEVPLRYKGDEVVRR